MVHHLNLFEPAMRYGRLLLWSLPLQSQPARHFQCVHAGWFQAESQPAAPTSVPSRNREWHLDRRIEVDAVVLERERVGASESTMPLPPTAVPPRLCEHVITLQYDTRGSALWIKLYSAPGTAPTSPTADKAYSGDSRTASASATPGRG